jgi:hypothetical protein
LLLVLVHVLFLQYFNGAFFFRFAVSAQSDFSEGTFAKDMSDLVNIAEGALPFGDKEF